MKKQLKTNIKIIIITKYNNNIGLIFANEKSSNFYHKIYY